MRWWARMLCFLSGNSQIGFLAYFLRNGDCSFKIWWRSETHPRTPTHRARKTLLSTSWIFRFPLFRADGVHSAQHRLSTTPSKAPAFQTRILPAPPPSGALPGRGKAGLPGSPPLIPPALKFVSLCLHGSQLSACSFLPINSTLAKVLIPLRTQPYPQHLKVPCYGNARRIWPLRPG